MAEQPPLILTLKIDEPAFTFFNNLRQKHFPPAINYLDAHLTLFHHLPNMPAVAELLETLAINQPVILLEVNNLMKLGRGVAYAVRSPELLRLHKYLKQQWQEYLTPQDRQELRPHITVQNKVTPETANLLYEELNATFTPFAAAGLGFSLWEYRGGPWHKVANFDFSGAPANPQF